MTDEENAKLLEILHDVKEIALAGKQLSDGCSLMAEMLAVQGRLVCFLLLRELGTLDIDVVVRAVNGAPIDEAMTDAIYRGMGITTSTEVH